MKKPFPALLILAGTLLIVAGRLDAETRYISWTAVTAYTDGTPIEPTKTVTYDVFWTTDGGLSPASLRMVTSPTSQTSATFDPDVLGMPRGQTVYFTGDAVLNTGERSTLASAYSWYVPFAAPPPGAPTLSSLSISGPESLNESGSGTYTAAAIWSDSTTTSVTPIWSVSPATYAAISTEGVLTTMAVTSNQGTAVNASYTSGGVTRTATIPVTIVDVPPGALDPPRNVVITGPVETSPAILFRLGWDPVARYADGTPIAAGTVLYTAYWTADPALSIASLQTLAPSTSATSVTFDPAAAGMTTNQRIYFTAVATTTSGGQSPLSAGVPWVALNAGPAAPSRGTIIKR